jgi:hypothetical protein
MLAKRTLYYLRQSTSSFCFGYFWDRVSLYAWTGLDHGLPIYASLHSGKDRYMLLYPAIGWDKVLQTFCLGWPKTDIFPISAFQVSRIRGWTTVSSLSFRFFHANIWNHEQYVVLFCVTKHTKTQITWVTKKNLL